MKNWERVILSLWLPVLLTVAWETSARMHWVDPIFFPPPTAVAVTAGELIVSGELLTHIGVTLRRTIISYLFALLAGLACGTAMALRWRINRSLEPLISALYSTPKVSFLPMLLLLFGIGETARLVLVGATAFIVITLYAFDAVRGINPAFGEMAHSYGARRWQLLGRVYIPAALPQIFTGVRLAFGRALLMTITTELVQGNEGIGAMLWMAGQTLATEKLYVGIITSATLGGLSHRLLRRLEAASVPWKGAHVE